MKKLFLMALALSMLHDVAAADSSCPSLVITGHPSYPPVSWGSDSEIVGAAPEMVANIARTLGVKKVTSRNFGSWEKAQAPPGNRLPRDVRRLLEEVEVQCPEGALR